VKQKRLAKDAPIPCIVKTTGIAEDDSLAENNDREALHPLDQFRAFAALSVKGQSDEDIAAAFGVTPAVVRQRLRLAAASPKLLEAYAGDALNLEQLMAFCVTADHTRQEQVLQTIMQGQVGDSPYTIRRLLTETCVEATDPRARFAGIEAYLAAGGTIMRDLFEPDDGGWLQDPPILMQLVSEKLATERERILAQGWKWAEAALEMPYDLKFRLRRLQPIAEALTEKDEKRYLALSEEHDGLIEGLEDDQDTPTEVRTRLAAIEAELAEIDNRPPKFAPEDVARSGVLLSIGHNGQLDVEYGFVRPEDATDSDARDPDAEDDDTSLADGEEEDHTPNSAANGADTDADDAMVGKSLPDRLIQELTAYRTVALRDALARDFDTAFLAVLHAMCLDLFYVYGARSCLQINAKHHMPMNVAGLADLVAAKAIEERHAQWQAKLPEDATQLWDALVRLSGQESLAPLFAHCAGLTVNAVREPHQPRREALRHADRLAAALSLDMASAGWSAMAGNYLGRVTKAQILEAVREAKGDNAVQLVAHLKKADMAREAERLLDGTGWLPVVLRTPPLGDTTAAAADGDAAPALPDFLMQDAEPQ
jgi:ParB family chromosome partitioning protein